MPSFISLISSVCHQLIICACQGSDTLDSLHAVGEQRQDDDTVADKADLAAGQWCKLHSTVTDPPFVPVAIDLIVCFVKHSNI